MVCNALAFSFHEKPNTFTLDCSLSQTVDMIYNFENVDGFVEQIFSLVGSGGV